MPNTEDEGRYTEAPTGRQILDHLNAGGRVEMQAMSDFDIHPWLPVGESAGNTLKANASRPESRDKTFSSVRLDHNSWTKAPEATSIPPHVADAMEQGKSGAIVLNDLDGPSECWVLLNGKLVWNGLDRSAFLAKATLGPSTEETDRITDTTVTETEKAHWLTDGFAPLVWTGDGRTVGEIANADDDEARKAYSALINLVDDAHRITANQFADARRIMEPIVKDILAESDQTDPGEPQEAAEPSWADLLVCCRCRGPLAAPGAVIITPPMVIDGYDAAVRQNVDKLHVCVTCWPIVESWLDGFLDDIREPSDINPAKTVGVIDADQEFCPEVQDEIREAVRRGADKGHAAGMVVVDDRPSVENPPEISSDELLYLALEEFEQAPLGSITQDGAAKHMAQAIRKHLGLVDLKVEAPTHTNSKLGEFPIGPLDPQVPRGAHALSEADLAPTSATPAIDTQQRRTVCEHCAQGIQWVRSTVPGRGHWTHMTGNIACLKDDVPEGDGLRPGDFYVRTASAPVRSDDVLVIDEATGDKYIESRPKPITPGVTPFEGKRVPVRLFRIAATPEFHGTPKDDATIILERLLSLAMHGPIEAEGQSRKKQAFATVTEVNVLAAMAEEYLREVRGIEEKEREETRRLVEQTAASLGLLTEHIKQRPVLVDEAHRLDLHWIYAHSLLKADTADEMLIRLLCVRSMVFETELQAEQAERTYGSVQPFTSTLGRDLTSDEMADFRIGADNIDLERMYADAMKRRGENYFAATAAMLCLRLAKKEHRTIDVLMDLVANIRDQLPFMEDLKDRVDPDNEDRDLLWPTEFSRLSGKIDGMSAVAQTVEDYIKIEEEQA